MSSSSDHPCASKLPPLRTARCLGQYSQQRTVRSTAPPPAQCNASIPVLGCSRDFFATTDPASAAWGLAPSFTLPLALALRPSAPKLAWPGPSHLSWLGSRVPVQVRLPFPAQHTLFIVLLSPLLNQSPGLRLPSSSSSSSSSSVTLHPHGPLLRVPTLLRILFFCPSSLFCVLFVHFQSAGLLLLQHRRSTELEQSRLSSRLGTIVALVNQTGLAGTLTSRGISRRTARTTLLTPTTKYSRSQLFCQSNPSTPFSFGIPKS